MDAATYEERLSVPLRWWAQGTMFVAACWLAVIVALPEPLAWSVTGVAAAVTIACLTAYGSARVEVADGWFRAGRARIAGHHLGPATALDATATRHTVGAGADARAYLVYRPYLRQAVRVEIADPADPAPYWLVSSRHPQQLARALKGLTSSAH